MVKLELKYKILRVSDTEEFKKMAYALYEEDSDMYGITEEKLKATIQESVLNKEHLKIILLWLGDEIIGYCIVVTYWSNRLGGNLIHIDEIYLKPEFRNKGYAQQAIKAAEKIHGSENWCLGTILQEKGNCHFYEKLGYHRIGKIDNISDIMDIVYYEKDS